MRTMDVLQEINQKGDYCWRCRKEVSPEEVMELEEEGIMMAKLCFDCLDLRMEPKRNRFF